MLMVLLGLTCENIPVENTVVGAMMPEFEKMGKSMLTKTEEASWLVSAKLYSRRIMRDCRLLRSC